MDLVLAGTALVAATYGLVRGAYGLVLPAVQEDLGLTQVGAGVVSGLTSLSYCVAAGLSLLTCQRHPRAVVLAAGATGSLGAAGVAAAPDVAWFAVAVVLGSAGAGATSPALVVLVARAVRGSRSVGAQSVVNAGPGPGLVLAGLLALAVGQQWRAAWVLAAVATATATAWTLRASRDLGHGPGPGPAVDLPLDGHRGRAVDLSRAWLAPAAGAFAFGAGSAAVWTYGRSVLQQAGVAPGDAVLAWVALGVGAALSAPIAPWLLRRGTHGGWAATVLVTAGATWLVAVADDRWAGWLASLLFGVGFNAGTTVLIAYAVQVSRTPGPAASAFFVAALLGQAAGAPLVGRLLEHGAAVAFGAAAVATLVGAGSVLTVGLRTSDPAPLTPRGT